MARGAIRLGVTARGGPVRAADLSGRPRTPTVAGTDSPTAWGHRFGAGLCCDWCGTTWGAHEAKPRPCVRTPGEHPPPASGEAHRGS